MSHIWIKAKKDRKKLRDKFLKAGIGALQDYGIVELLLTLGMSRKDCKEQAKAAIKKFKRLRGVLEASLEQLREIEGLGPVNAFGINLFHAISERYLEDKIIHREWTLRSTKEVFDYLCQ